MKTRRHISTLSMAETWAREFLALKAQVSKCEEQLEPLKVNLKTFLKEATPAQRAILAGREFFMSERVTETFDLKRARQVVSEKVLKPFVKLVSSESLRFK